MNRSDATVRAAIAVLAAAVLGLSVHMGSRATFPFPPFTTLVWDIGREFERVTSYEKPLGAEGGYRDFAGVLLGMRRLAADVAWVSVLQYYGTHEQDAKEDHDDGHTHGHGPYDGGRYFALKKMVLRVMRLDPSMQYATLYGAGALAFNLDRPQEALELLEEGIRNSPTYWRYRLYVGAILFKQKGQFDEMINLLEDAITYPDCPTMVKSILAGIYKDRKDYARALRVWLDVLENPRTDVWYRSQAEKQIQELRVKLGI